VGARRKRLVGQPEPPLDCSIIPETIWEKEGHLEGPGGLGWGVSSALNGAEARPVSAVQGPLWNDFCHLFPGILLPFRVWAVRVQFEEEKYGSR
jgi:hypothetical protein